MTRTQESWSWTVILILLSLVLPGSGLLAHAGSNDAGGLDPASTEALAKTQALLTTPAVRDKAIHDSPSAQLVDSQVKALGGSPGVVESIYGLSSDIFEDLVKETHGDPEKMQELLVQAKVNPKAFAEHLSEKNKRALREVAGQITNAPTTAAPVQTPAQAAPAALLSTPPAAKPLSPSAPVIHN